MVWLCLGRWLFPLVPLLSNDEAGGGGRGVPLVTSALHHQVVIVVWLLSLQLTSSPWTGGRTVINHSFCCPVLSLGSSKFVPVKSGYGEDHWALRTGRLIVAGNRKAPFIRGVFLLPPASPILTPLYLPLLPLSRTASLAWPQPFQPPFTLHFFF